jgi:argininosuccinate synthase
MYGGDELMTKLMQIATELTELIDEMREQKRHPDIVEFIADEGQMVEINEKLIELVEVIEELELGEIDGEGMG